MHPRRGLTLLALAFLVLANVAATTGEPTIRTDGPNPFAMWGAVAIALIATGIVVAWYMRGRSRRRR